MVRYYCVRGCGEHVRGGAGGGGFGRWSSGVDRRDDGEVVLVFEEIGAGCGVSLIQRVEEGGVEGAEGQFVDYMGEVEGYILRQHRHQMQGVK